MRIEFLRRAIQNKSYVNKYTFKVSGVDSLQDFLTYFLRQVELMGVFDLTPNSRVGFELYSNVKIGAPALYIPLKKKESLNNDDLIFRLQKISVSESIFLDLDQEFEIVIGVVEI